jgi:hypothetical protein
MRWSAKRAQKWYEDQPWFVGCNYAPRNAINQLEMWQKETFSPDLIDEELGWAASLGFNSVRVFLHDLLWEQDSRGFLRRMDQFLRIAKRHGIGAMVVFFDSVWHPFPHLGRQREPEPGVHNSGWVQSPGVSVLRDEKRFDALGEYVTGVVRHFADDPRVHVWDVWNEPDNSNSMSYGPRDLGAGKAEVVERLLPRVFQWARAGKPSQPLTCGVWAGEWMNDQTLKPYEKVQLENSDVVSFHCYGLADEVEKRIGHLQANGRPMFCTEYMSRGSGSTFETVLPVLHKHRVGAYNWGFVAGKTQTNYPWDSWQRPYTVEPDPWFHEIFRPDGEPYGEQEVATIRLLTGVPKDFAGPKIKTRKSKSARGRRSKGQLAAK